MGFSFVPLFGNLTHFFPSSRLMRGLAKRTVRQLAIEKPHDASFCFVNVGPILVDAHRFATVTQRSQQS